MCHIEICVKLFTLRTSHRAREEEVIVGGLEQDANPNVVPGLCANTGNAGQQNALGGHPFFMRCDGSGANILFAKEKEPSKEAKVHNHSQGHYLCL